MKKAEIILIVLIIISIVLKFLHIRGSYIAVILLFGVLANIYMFFGFALFNNIRLRDVFKKDSYVNTNTIRIIGAVGMGLVLAMLLFGILFRIMNYPGADIQLLVSSFLLLNLLVAVLLKIKKDKTQYHKNLLKRIAFYGVIGVFLLAVPRATWLQWSYPNHPDYIEAIIKAENNPNNLELRNKMEEERQKMFEQTKNKR